MGTQPLIDLNSAELQELSAIDGLGEVGARKIIEYRRDKGAFRSLEDVRNIPGLGETLIQRLSTAVRVGTPRAAQSTAQLSKNLVQLLSKMHRLNLIEIELAQLVQQKTVSDDVGEYAELLERDYRHLEDELHRLASKRKVSLDAPDQDPALKLERQRHDEIRERIERADRDDVDEIYVEALASEQESILRQLQDAKRHSSDDTVTELLVGAISRLQHHLATALELRAAI